MNVHLYGTGKTHFTPVMEAIVNRHEGAALHLLQLGADVVENNINGDQALHLAAEKDLAAVFIEVMNAHEDALFQYNDEGLNPFLSAAYHGSDSVLAAILFSCGKDDQDILWSSITTQTHRNALHCAVAGDHFRTVAFLLDYAPWSALCIQDIVSRCCWFYRGVYYHMCLCMSPVWGNPTVCCCQDGIITNHTTSSSSVWIINSSE